MKLNDKDYKYFDIAVQEINRHSMSKLAAKEELLMTLGYFTSSYCKEAKRGNVEPKRMVDFLLEVHAEYEAILTKLEEIEGGETNESRT